MTRLPPPRTPWILIGVGAFAPNQMESGVMGDYFRSKNGSIGWVHAWAKSLGAVELHGARWTPAAGAEVPKPNETKPQVWPYMPGGPLSRPQVPAERGEYHKMAVFIE